MQEIVSVPLYLLKMALWTRMWSVLGNTPRTAEKRAALAAESTDMLSPFGLCYSLTLGCLPTLSSSNDLAKDENGAQKSRAVIASEKLEAPVSDA